MHINLILETEQRSASPVSPAAMVRILIGTAVVLLVLWLLSVYMAYRDLKAGVAGSENQWTQTEPKYIAAKQLRNDLALKTDKLKELQGWHTTRIEWASQLESIQRVIPSLIQLTELRVSQEILILSNSIPARVFELHLSGKTGSSRSEINVSDFQEALFKLPPFDSFVESVSIPQGAFRQDPANKSDRVFEIVSKYLPRSFK